MAFISTFEADMVDPNWEAFKFISYCRSIDSPALPPPFLRMISILFFPDGCDHPIDVSEHSNFEYAQELRELLPTESQKGNLTREDIESAFLRLALNYARRTTRLQLYGNRMFRTVLAHQIFRTRALPAYLLASSDNDQEEILTWEDGAGLDLIAEEDSVEGPGDGLLLRTATTSAEVLAQPMSPEVLKWEDSTYQLCHFLLMTLLGLPLDGAGPPHTVCLQDLKSAGWLNGAEGTLGERHATGRFYVDLHFPKSAVDQAIANDRLGRPRVLISPDNITKWPGASDQFSLRGIQDNVAGRPGAKILLQNSLPFISLFTRGNIDTQISMAEMVSKIKQASHLMCWSEKGFTEPVYAYLTRKLRHVSRRVKYDASPHAPPPHALLVEGRDYYASMGETSDCGSLIYYPVKLVSFSISSGLITAHVHCSNDAGAILSLLMKFSAAVVSDAFVPTAEFESRPRGIVCTPLAAEPDGYDPPPADWSTYDSDTRDILASLAVCCAQFKMDSAMLPGTGRASPFSIRNGVSSLQFTEIDHGASFQPFFSDKMTSGSAQQRDKLLQTPALREIHRCFFIHLGVALGLHPVALQAVFRAHSDALLKRIQLALSQKTHEDDQRFDEVKMLEGSLQSVLRPNDMIEAPILSIVWPQEFQELQNVRILILTVGRSGPQPNACYLFSPRAAADDADSFEGVDVILKLQGLHFTLLRPLDEHSSHSPIDKILDIFPDIVEIRPLHLQESDAGDIVRDVGRVQSLADLHRAHSPAPALTPDPVPQNAFPPKPECDELEHYD